MPLSLKLFTNKRKQLLFSNSRSLGLHSLSLWEMYGLGT